MGTFVFLSYSAPVDPRQNRFVSLLESSLRERALEPRTLGVTDHDSDSPLRAVRRVLLETNGLVLIAFRRLQVEQASPAASKTTKDAQWTTSPWCHIEAAMAFGQGLPVLVLCEEGVIIDGVLRAGVLDTGVVRFDLDEAIPPFFRSMEWRQNLDRWQHHVRTVVERKGYPRRMY